MKDLSNAIGIFFLSQRQQSGKSLEEISSLTGFSVPRLESLERGETGTSWPFCDLNTLARVFDASFQFAELFLSESLKLKKPNPRDSQ
jgi:transcriptional regulator with XRE-family HTH domain